MIGRTTCILFKDQHRKVYTIMKSSFSLQQMDSSLILTWRRTRCFKFGM